MASQEYDYDDYEAADLKCESFLTDIPISLLKENIERQFKEPLDHRRVDYISTFIRRMEYSRQVIETDIEYEDQKEELEEIYNDFLSFLLKIFKNFLNITFYDIDSKSEKEQMKILRYTYRFFITNIKANFVNAIIEYITRNKEDLVSICTRKKDAFHLSLKDNDIDADIAVIIANISDIINHSLSQMDCEIFLNYLDTGENLEAELFHQYFENNDVNGNFMQYYIDMLDQEFMIDIETKIQRKLLKRYKNK